MESKSCSRQGKDVRTPAARQVKRGLLMFRLSLQHYPKLSGQNSMDGVRHSVNICTAFKYIGRNVFRTEFFWSITEHSGSYPVVCMSVDYCVQKKSMEHVNIRRSHREKFENLVQARPDSILNSSTAVLQQDFCQRLKIPFSHVACRRFQVEYHEDGGRGEYEVMITLTLTLSLS